MFVKRLFFSLLGNLLLGLGVGCFLISQIGADPYSSFILGLKELLPLWHISMLFLVSNAALFVLGLIFCRSFIGWGTVFNMILVGAVADTVLAVQLRLFGTLTDWPWQFLASLIGILLLSFGAAVYFSSDLGLAPYDLASRLMQEKWRLPYRYMRMITDFICLLFCFCCGGRIGWGSALSVVCIGPLIQFFTSHVTNRMVGYPIPDGDQVAK